jgi:hypothetical protein
MFKRKMTFVLVLLSFLSFGLIPSASQAKVTFVLTFAGHVTYDLNSYEITAKEMKGIDSVLKANKDATTWGIIGYAHRLEIGPDGEDGTPGNPVTLSLARAKGVRDYIALKYPKLKLNVYGKGIKLGDTTLAGPRVVSLYAQKPVGKPDPPGPSISGTFKATSTFSVDAVYVTRVSVMGPVRRMAKYPLDGIDSDLIEPWKFLRLKPGTYKLQVTMMTTQDGTCLSLLPNSFDKTQVYGGKANGWSLDPTDEMCLAKSKFTAFKVVKVGKKAVTGQDFTIGFADLLGTD